MEVKDKPKNNTITKLTIVKETFLGEFKLEDYLVKEASLLIEKYK